MVLRCPSMPPRESVIRPHPVMRLHIQQQWRDHGNCLLTSDCASLVLPDDQLVNLLQKRQLAQLGAAESTLPCQLVGIPREGLWGLQQLTIHLPQTWKIIRDLFVDLLLGRD